MHFTDLRVYKISADLAVALHKALERIPKWKAPEIGQVLRSSSSISANIAEGHGRNQYPTDHIRFLSMALGSSDETQNHLYLLFKKGFFAEEQYVYLAGEYKNLSVRILNFINAIKKINSLSS
jgi:four helix bundle protein